MKFDEHKSFCRIGGELSVTSSSLPELLSAVFDRGKPFRFQARGFSMYPYIRDGDVVTLSPIGSILPRLTDVVAFVHPQAGRLVIHRIIGKKDGLFIIKGDNVPVADGFIPRANILGRVTDVHRNNRKILLSILPGRLQMLYLMCRRLVWPFLSPVWRIFNYKGKSVI